MKPGASDLRGAQSVYRTSAAWIRDNSGMDKDFAARYYDRCVSFAASHLGRPGSRVLDVGCGYGWTTWLLRRKGHCAIGLDLHNGPLDARGQEPSLPYVRGDIASMPFPPETFDAVAFHETLEHVPDPEGALLESLRVLKPGGRLIISGPNLLCFALNLSFAVRHTLRVLGKGGLWERRTPDLPRHPWGNTMPESWGATLYHLWQTLKKLLGERPARFLMRVPDSKPPFDSDNDACYLCNPMDLVNWARDRADVKAVRWWAPHHLAGRWLWPFRAGTWIVLEKAHGP